MLSKGVAEKTRELRKLRGEELQGLDMEELMKLEKLLDGKLRRVVKTKDDKILKETDALKNKEAQLMEENARLRQETVDIAHGETNALPQGHSSLSITNYCISVHPPQGCNSFDTSLKLGLPFSN
ncbi:unnamed protein product [Ilex paraguariensis]|uniref:K-box domain-containing protein n=1 Tax=Ilex paraguariensis TaxID=185542 RepID=A0ABC8UDE9_9AQUA